MKLAASCPALCSIVLGATSVMGILLFAGCTTLPPEQKYTAAQLREKARKPMPACVKEQCVFSGDGTLHCYDKQEFSHRFAYGENCKRDYYQWKETTDQWRDALERRYNRDAAAAPSCIRQRTVPSALFEIVKIDPNAPDAIAQALARGAFVPFDDQKCTADLCQWRLRVEPSERSTYCEMASRNLASRGNRDTQSD